MSKKKMRSPSEWQVVARHFFPENEAGKHTFLLLHFLHHLDILDAVPVIVENRLRFQLLSSCPAQFQILLFLVDAQEATSQQIGSDAGGTAAGEWVKNPSPRFGRSQNDASKEGERLLRRMFALRFLPSCDGWQPPYIRHLLVFVQPFHQLVVVIMRHLLLFSCPDNELGGVSKVSARDIGRRICLSPRNDIQNLNPSCVSLFATEKIL